MRKFLRTSPRMLMLASAAIVIVLIVCLLLSQKGSVFGDQSAADWAAALGRDPTTAKKRLRAGGAKAVPVLVELLESAGGLTASDAAEVLYEIAPQAPAALPPLLAVFPQTFCRIGRDDFPTDRQVEHCRQQRR